MTVHDLDRDERTVFAGALRRLVQAEGWVTDGEIAGIEELRSVFGFDDLDESLDRFVARCRSGDDLDAQARRVTRPEARAFVLERLEQVSLMDGYRDRTEEAFLQHLRSLWS